MSKKNKILICLISLSIALLLGVSIFLLTGHKHQYGEWQIRQDSTCFEQGSRVRTCTVCQKEETEAIPLAPHNYSELQSVWSDNGNLVEIKCSVCHNASMQYKGGYSLQTGIVNLRDCATDFYFDVVCADGEAVIRDNLTIVETLFADADDELLEAASDEYLLAQISENTWRVTPAKLYLERTGYTVLLGERVSFLSFPGSTLAFRTSGVSEEVAEFRDDILFLRNLETQTPGYYPYSIEFDADNAIFHLTVSQQGVFTEESIGRILCVGDCSDMESAIMLDSDEVDIGRIETVETIGGTTHITLGPVGLEDIYSELDMSLGGQEMLVLEEFDEECRLAFAEAALTSEAFLSSYTDAQAVAAAYAKSIGGYTTDVDWHKELEDLMASMKFSESTTTSGNVTKAFLTVGLDNYDISLKIKKDSVHVASVVFSFTFKDEIEILVDGNVNRTNLEEYVKDKINIFVDKNITAEFHAELDAKSTFTFHFGVNIQNVLQKNYYVVNPKSLVIHADFCRHAAELGKDASNCFSLPEIINAYGEDYKDKQCKVCQPFDETKFFVINGRNGMVHRGNCLHVSAIGETHMYQAYIRPAEGEKFGNTTYQYCDNCSPGNVASKTFRDFIVNSSENANVEKMYSFASDMIGDALNLKESQLDKNTKTSKLKLWILEFGFSVTPVFNMEAKASFDFTYVDITKKSLVFDLQYSEALEEYVVASDVLDVALSPEEKALVTTSLDIAGSVGIKSGVQLAISIGPVVVSEWFNVRAVMEAGAYTDMSLMGHIDFRKTEESYAVGYVDMGLYVKVTTDYTIASHTSKPYTVLPEIKLSLFSLGDDVVCYGFSDYEQVLSIVNQKTWFLDDNLLSTSCYSLREQQGVPYALSFRDAKQNGYKLAITVTDAEGNPLTYCNVTNGVLSVAENAPDVFTAYMHIVATDTDPVEWADLLDIKGTQPLGTQYSLPELVVEIRYDSKGTPISPDQTPSEGLAFTSNGDGTCYVSGIGSCTDSDIVIPDAYNGQTVTSIGDWAFSECSGLTSITIPDSVTSIGESAFLGCTNLTSITIPDSVTVIDAQALCGCSGLTTIAIPNSVTSIGEHAFYECTGLTSITIPNSVTTIGYCAFYGCTSLTGIIIPDSVTSIDEGAFGWCSGLTSLTVELGNPVYHSSGNCIIETASKTLVLGCSNSLIPTDGSVTSIGNWAFLGCMGLTSITIPDSVTSIGFYAFFGCSSLTSITIPNSVTTIGEYAFYECVSLTDIYFSGSEEQWRQINIGDSNDCLFNARIHFSDGGGSPLTPPINSIPLNALYYNGHYYYVFSVENVTNWDAARAYCESLGGYLATITSQAENDAIYSQLLKQGYKSAYFGLTDSETEGIWQWVTGEPVDYFNWHSGEPNSESSREDYAMFYYKFKDGTWNDGKCTGSTVTFICEWAVQNQPIYGSSEGLEFTSNGDGTCYVSGIGSCTDTDIVIPDVYSGQTVTSIGEWAFCGSSGLTSITIPNSVTSIGREAFADCASLTSIIIPERVTSIGVWAFFGCASLTNITVELGNPLYHSAGNCIIETASKTLVVGCANSTIPADGSVTSIGDWALGGCSGLTSIIIPDSVTSIGNGAFLWCTGVTSITIPDSVTSIGSNAFYGCSSLTSIDFGENCQLTSIGSWTFYGCSGLTNISIPNSVTSIHPDAFYGCTSLTNITVELGNLVYHSAGNCIIETASKTLVVGCGNSTIPADGSVTSIGNWAFCGSSGLTSIIIPNSVTSIGILAFEDCTSLAHIVFDGSIAQWKAIAKGFCWNDDVPATEVICTDGTVKLQ